MPGVFSDPDIDRFTRSIPFPYTAADAAEALVRYERLRESGEALTLFVEQRSDGALVGSCGFLNIKGTAQA